MGLSFWHLLVVLTVVLVMGDLGKGIRSFKAGLSGDDKIEDKGDDTPKLPPSA